MNNAMRVWKIRLSKIHAELASLRFSVFRFDSYFLKLMILNVYVLNKVYNLLTALNVFINTLGHYTMKQSLRPKKNTCFKKLFKNLLKVWTRYHQCHIVITTWWPKILVLRQTQYTSIINNPKWFVSLK